jgi:hypothetical protein
MVRIQGVTSVIPWTEFKGRRVKNNNNVVYNIPVIQKFQIFVVAHSRLATGEINIV